MKIFHFDIFLSKKIAERFNNKQLKLLSDISDILLLFYCFIAIFISLKNVIYILIGWAIPNILQKLFIKERPYSFFKINIYYKSPRYNSLPSSHTFLSIFLFFSILKVNLFLALFILIIPILRILSLQHWFSDIIFSIALSTIIHFAFLPLILRFV